MLSGWNYQTPRRVGTRSVAVLNVMNPTMHTKELFPYQPSPVVQIDRGALQQQGVKKIHSKSPTMHTKGLYPYQPSPVVQIEVHCNSKE